MGAAIAAAGAAAAANASAIGAAVAVATAAATAAMSIRQSNEQADAQEKYNKKLTEDAIRQYGELDKAEADAIYESHANSMQAQREYLTARSSVQLQAAATGTYGNSMNLAIQDLNTGFGGRMADITYQRDSQLDAIDMKAEQIQRSPSMNADTTIQQPSYYTGFTTGISTYNTMSGITGKVANAYKDVKPAKTS
jgi:GTP:adenosylcobinamide-phosphate guanylyltransferase